MQKAYFYPPKGLRGYPNPYCQHFRDALSQHYKVVYDRRLPNLFGTLPLLLNALHCDQFFVNWLENIGYMHLAPLQYCVARIALWIIRKRGKRIVWIMHNIHPHQGENRMSRSMQQVLFEQSDLIVAHSKEAAAFARDKAGDKVRYICHPVGDETAAPLCPVEGTKTDVLIWGTILPYKGIVEFLSLPFVRKNSLRVQIVGRCTDAVLSRQIEGLCNDSVTFRNTNAPSAELRQLCQNARWVLFPYIGDCVSSSGSLIDTIVWGGNPLGPARGAFRDLAEEGVCHVYKDYGQLAELLASEPQPAEDKRRDFVNRNGWPSFINQLV